MLKLFSFGGLASFDYVRFHLIYYILVSKILYCKLQILSQKSNTTLQIHYRVVFGSLHRTVLSFKNKVLHKVSTTAILQNFKDGLKFQYRFK